MVDMESLRGPIECCIGSMSFPDYPDGLKWRKVCRYRIRRCGFN